MESIVNRIRSKRAALIGLVLALYATALLTACGDSGGSLDSLNIPNTEAGFIEAAGKGNLEAVRLFVGAGMKVTGADSPGRKAFAAAVKRRQGPVLAYLRQAGVVTSAEAELRRREVPYSVEEYLTRAAAGDVATVRLFLAAGMKPSAQSVDGRSALGEAERNRQKEMAAVLKAAGASINQVYNLKTMGFEFTPRAFLEVVKQGNLKVVKVFVESGMRVNIPDDSGITPLAWGVHGDNLEMVKYLLAENADPNAELLIPGGIVIPVSRNKPLRVRDVGVNVALLEAVYHKNLKMAKLLANHKAVSKVYLDFFAVYQGNMGVLMTLRPPDYFRGLNGSILYQFALRNRKNKRVAKLLAKMGASRLSSFDYRKYYVGEIIVQKHVFESLEKKFKGSHPEYSGISRAIPILY